MSKQKFVDDIIDGLLKHFPVKDNGCMEVKPSNIVVFIKARVEIYEKAGLLIFTENENSGDKDDTDNPISY